MSSPSGPSLPRRQRPTLEPGTGRIVLSPQEPVQTIINGVMSYAALLAFAQLKIADHLAERAQHVTDLVARCIPGAPDTAPDMLSRVLRALRPLGIVEIDAEGYYHLTPAGHTLVSTAEDSMRPGVLMAAEPLWWEAARTLADTIRAGRPVALGEYASPYAYLQQHQEAEELFDAFMSARSHPIAQALARQDVTGVEVVADIGGGHGTVLAALLTAHPHLRGILLERGSVTDRARHLLAERCDVVEGDMFAAIPPGAQLYLLSSVVHNWGQDDATRLLTRVAQAMAQTSGPTRLWCVDALVPQGGDQRQAGYALDLKMMSLFPDARERPLSAFAALMWTAGLQITSISYLPHGLSLLTAELL